MKVLLVGMGKSNISAYKALKRFNHEVDCLVDDKYRVDGYSYIDINKIDIDEYDYIIRSPGINVFHPFYKLIEKKDNVICEIELAYILSLKKGFYIGVSGSNGKTTTVTLLSNILRRKYKKVILAGNIGSPLCDYIELIDDETVIVLEISSFQLERVNSLHLNISLLLNLCPNHLDSVYSLDYYYSSKFNIVKNQNEKDIFIFPFEYKCYLKNKNVRCVNLDDLNFDFQTNLDGVFNRKNINCIYFIASFLGVEDNVIKDEISIFKPLKYRMEKIAKIGKTVFINDSKSTTVDSTIACFNSYKGKKLLICGGKDKNINFSNLDYIKKKLCFGEIRNKLNGIKEEKLWSFYPYIKDNYKDYDYVIFSPATSSFDQYNSYIERGEEFNQMIERLGYEENKT